MVSEGIHAADDEKWYQKDYMLQMMKYGARRIVLQIMKHGVRRRVTCCR